MAKLQPGSVVFGLAQGVQTSVDVEMPLTFFSFGWGATVETLWKKRRKGEGSISLLVLNSSKQFVFLVDNTPSSSQSRSQRIKQVLSRMTASSPFKSSRADQKACVVAFEVEWSNIVGLDYQNQLCMDGRVVIEAKHTTKREFHTMKDAHDRYIAHTHQPRPISARRAESAPKLPTSFPASTHPNLLASGSQAWLHGQNENNQGDKGNSRALRSLKLDRLSSSGTGVQNVEDQEGQVAQVQPVRSKSASLPDLGAVIPADGVESPLLQSGIASSQPGDEVVAAKGAAGGGPDGDDMVDMRRRRPAALVLPDDSAAPTGLSPELLSAEPANEPGKWGLPASKPSTSLQNGRRWLGDEWDGRGEEAGAAKGADANSKEGGAHGKTHRAGLYSKEVKVVGKRVSGTEVVQQARVDEAGARVEDSERWPPASSWTMATATFEYRSITFNFRDPMLPGVLQPVIQGDERLLKLYESGLPAWAIYMPQYGLWYRPWLRTVTYLLFIAISVFSLVMGFYDLYKHFPYLDQVLRRLIGSFHLPSSAILEWLDDHVAVRLSILFAYLFGKSELAVQLLKWLATVGAFCRATVQPVIAVIGPPISSMATVVQQFGGQAVGTIAALGVMVHCAVAAVLGPPFQAFVDMLLFLRQLITPIAQVAKSVLLGPLALLRAFLGTLMSSAGIVWDAIRVVGQTAASAWGALKIGAKLAPSVNVSARDVGSQVAWWYVVPADTWDIVRTSAVKVVRGLQALARFVTQVACDIARHRLTLTIRISRRWAAFKARLSRILPTWLLAAWAWILTLLHGRGDVPDHPAATAGHPGNHSQNGHPGNHWQNGYPGDHWQNRHSGDYRQSGDCEERGRKVE